jgi:uncharacterized protein
MNHGLSQEDCREIISIFKQFSEVEEAILFGSRAKGNFKSGSDVDIAVKGQAIEHSCISRLSYLLNEESLLPYFFDIVHFEHIEDADLIRHIRRVGVTIFQRDGT